MTVSSISLQSQEREKKAARSALSDAVLCFQSQEREGKTARSVLSNVCCVVFSEPRERKEATITATEQRLLQEWTPESAVREHPERQSLSAADTCRQRELQFAWRHYLT